MKTYEETYKILNKINIGWNLGNYLDSHNKQYFIGENDCKTIEYVVNLWHNPIFNLKCFEELKIYGINCVRIPVTWCNFINTNNNKISISNEVLDYLKELINYGISKDFIIIVDMHHDDQTWLNIACSKKEFKLVKKQYKKIWEIIAFTFKDYNQNLIFEGMNEVIDRTNTEKYDWWGKKNFLFKNLNKLHNIFIRTVRRYSFQNKNRTLMIPTYGAQIHQHALKHFKMVKDKNIIIDLHYYSKEKDKIYFEEKFKEVFEYLINKKIPIFMGEIGSKKEFIQDFSYIKNYIDFLSLHNIKFALWDNGSSRSFINRQTAKFTHTELINYLKTN